MRNQKEFIVEIESTKFNCIYECSESCAKGFINMRLKRYTIHDGYKLYEVKATYAKQLKPNNYYIVAKSKSEAKQIFKNKYTWLNVISSISECEKEEVEYIINHPILYPIS